jgi:homoserine O-succinyltransferase/O-acetyltransferase
MPIVEGPLQNGNRAARSEFQTQQRYAREEPLVIGLINNMPDSALSTTDRQFRTLLSAASQAKPLQLRVFYIPEIPRSKNGQAWVEEHCEPIDELWENRIDGLIVTGTEPRADVLGDEPYWGTLARLVDWAVARSVSTIWSCLAAHAAVLHLDGITRIRRTEKLSGLFECVRNFSHPILSGTPARWRVPHSRYNEMSEDALVSKGYKILMSSPEAGADTFIREGKSLFIFFQGHPEYDRDSLLREYRRDVGRFIAGERNTYPIMPSGYFDSETISLLKIFRERVLRQPDAGLLSSFPTEEAASRLEHGWHEPAVSIYRNWLSLLQYGAFVSSGRADVITGSA